MSDKTNEAYVWLLLIAWICIIALQFMVSGLRRRIEKLEKQNSGVVQQERDGDIGALQ